MSESKPINSANLIGLVRGKPVEKQVQILQHVGMPEKEIPDYLRWVNSQPVQVEKKETSTASFQETTTWKQMQERIANLPPVETTPEPQPEPPTPFQRDIQVNKLIMGAPSKYDDASFNHPSLVENQIIRWLKNEFIPGNHLMALMLGDTGCGKTWGGIALMNQMVPVIVDPYDHRVCSAKGRFLTAYRASEMVFNQRNPDFKFQKQLDELLTVPVLMIDDLGAEPAGFRGGDFIAWFQNLMIERHRFNRKTILTANLTTQGFREVYGDRIVSRFNEIGLFIESTDADMRIH